MKARARTERETNQAFTLIKMAMILVAENEIRGF